MTCQYVTTCKAIKLKTILETMVTKSYFAVFHIVSEVKMIYDIFCSIKYLQDNNSNMYCYYCRGTCIHVV